MLEHREFLDQAAADLFYSSVEDGHEHASMTWTGHGWRVSFGVCRSSRRSEVELLAAMYDREKADGDADLHDAAARRAAAEVAADAASAAGLAGDAARWFCAGFEGADIKRENPRSAGFEREFRQGRAARHQETWRRQVAAETSSIYHNMPKFQIPHPVVYRDYGED